MKFARDIQSRKKNGAGNDQAKIISVNSGGRALREDTTLKHPDVCTVKRGGGIILN